MELSLNQIVTGFALYVSAMKFYGISLEPHALLAVRLSELSAVSQIQIVMVARVERQVSLHLRWLSSLLYGCTATFWNIVILFRNKSDRLEMIVGFLFLFVLQSVLIGWTLLYISLRAKQRMSRPEQITFRTDALSIRGVRFVEFTERLVLRWPYDWPGLRIAGSVIALASNLYLTYTVCKLKFFTYEWKGKMCRLANEQDDRTTFGQVLAMMMMASMAYSLIESGLLAMLLTLAWSSLGMHDSKSRNVFTRQIKIANLDFLGCLRPGSKLSPRIELHDEISYRSIGSPEVALDTSEFGDAFLDDGIHLVRKPPFVHAHSYSSAASTEDSRS
jgi:hypothetical protein